MSNAIVAKIRSMYGNFLNENDYQELLKKKSVFEIASYLKNQTHYSEVLEDVREYQIHRGQLEDLIYKDQFIQVTKMMRYADPKLKSFYQIALLRVEMQTILYQIRAIATKEFDDVLKDMPYYLKPYLSIDLRKVGSAESMETLVKVLQKSIYKKILSEEVISKNLEYSDYELIFETFYYQTIFDTIDQHFRGKMKKELFKIFATSVELTNIVRIYRLKQYFDRDGDEIVNCLIPFYFGKIKKREMMELAYVKSAKEVLDFARKKNYEVGEAKEEEYVAVEYYQNHIEYRLLRKHIYYSIQSPLVFTSFMKLHENEISNLVNIIEGVRYGVDSEKIESMLIY